MKRIINTLLLFTFQFGYLEWGAKDHLQHTFIFQTEADVFSRASKDIQNVLHPFIIIPIIGMVLLVYTLFSNSKNKLISLIGFACLGLLMLLLLFIGIIRLDWKMIFSVIPFLAVGVVALYYYTNKKVAIK